MISISGDAKTSSRINDQCAIHAYISGKCQVHDACRRVKTTVQAELRVADGQAGLLAEMVRRELIELAQRLRLLADVEGNSTPTAARPPVSELCLWGDHPIPPMCYRPSQDPTVPPQIAPLPPRSPESRW